MAGKKAKKEVVSQKRFKETWEELLDTKKREKQKDARITILEQQIDKLSVELMKAKAEVGRPKPVIDVTVGETAVMSGQERKSYIARVAAYHHDFMGKRLLEMIGDVRGQFEQINRDTFGMSPTDFDIYLKGTINALWLLHNWGEDAVNEQISYQTPEITNEEVGELKDKLNENGETI